MTLGLENAFSRFYFDYKAKPQLLKSYLSTLIIFILCNSILISLLLLPFGSVLLEYFFKSKEFTFYPFGITAILSALFASVGSVFINYQRNKQNLKTYTYYALSIFILSTISETLAIVVFKADAGGVIIAKLVPTAIITSYFVIRLLIHNGIFFEFRFLRESFKYALPLIPYSAFGLLFLYYDRVLIENKLDLESLAVYNVAMSIAHITDSFMFAVQMATYPIIYELLKQNSKANLDKVSQTYRFIGVIVLFVMSAIIFCSPLGIINFLDAVYLPAIQIIPIILISYAFRYLYIVYVEPLFFFKKTKYLAWLSIFSGTISIIGNIILIPIYGIVGASATSVIARIAHFLPAYYYYLKIKTFRFKLDYIFTLIFVTFFISGIIFVFYDYLIKHQALLYLISFAPMIFITGFLYNRFLKQTHYKVFKPTSELIKKIF